MSVRVKLADLRNRTMLSSLAVTAGVMGFFASSAQAQDGAVLPDGYLAASGLTDVSSYTLEADGSVRLVRTDGSTIIIPADQVRVIEGVIYVEEAALLTPAAPTATEAAAGGGGGGAVLGVLGGVGLLGAAAGGGGGGGGGSSTGGGGGTVTPPVSNSAPSFTSGTTATAAENSTGSVYDANASDSDGDNLTYSISGGADASLFQINSSTGVVSFINVPDFENPSDSDADNVYEITVQVSDGTATTTQNVQITVTNVNEAPSITSGVAFDFGEGGTGTVFTAAATDPDGDAVTFSLEGTDAALFAINSNTGAVTFRNAPDFETPADADADNAYEVVIVASDGSNEVRQGVTISVTNSADAGTTITSAASSTVSEAQTSAYVIRAEADSAAELTYSISGADANLFNVNSETGEVSFIDAPDFEAPNDADNDGVYEIRVTASAGGASTSRNVSINITDVNEGAEVPNDQTTPITMVSGGSYTGELEVAGDEDWIAIEVVAGQRYEINLFGSGANPLVDPFVRIYDENGDLIAENDDISLGSVRDSRLSFTATETGTYYIEADAWDEGDDPTEREGDYTLTVEHTDPLREWTTQEIADYLDANGWGGAQWDISTGDTLTVNITDLTEDGQTLARAALEIWTDVTGIQFQEVSGSADISFDDDEDGAFARLTSISGGFIQGAEINISTQWLDDNGTGINSYSFQTYLHEIGHALGLGHAGPYNSTADYPTDAIYLNDSWQISVMSYFHQSENTYVDATFAFVLTPQLADILAVHDMYGAPASVRAGDTVYGFNSTAGNVVYDAESFETITSYTIIDSGGTDTMDYSGSAADQVLDLREDSFSSVQGGIGNVAIAIGTVIENAIGGTGDDIFYANAANNTLTGGAGDDVFIALGGNDVFNGGAGNDTAVFSGASSDYSITTNGAGNVVVTDLRAGAPDGVVELINVEDILYGGVLPDTAASRLFDENQAFVTEFDVPDFSAYGCYCHICSSLKDELAGKPGVSAEDLAVLIHDEASADTWVEFNVPLIDLDRVDLAEFMVDLTATASTTDLGDYGAEIMETIAPVSSADVVGLTGSEVDGDGVYGSQSVDLPVLSALPPEALYEPLPSLQPVEALEGWA